MNVYRQLILPPLKAGVLSIRRPRSFCHSRLFSSATCFARREQLEDENNKHSTLGGSIFNHINIELGGTLNLTVIKLCREVILLKCERKLNNNSFLFN